jgi:hypothetical protein
VPWSLAKILPFQPFRDVQPVRLWVGIGVNSGHSAGFSIADLRSTAEFNPTQSFPKGSWNVPTVARLRLPSVARPQVLGRRRLKDGNGSLGLNHLFKP